MAVWFLCHGEFVASNVPVLCSAIANIDGQQHAGWEGTHELGAHPGQDILWGTGIVSCSQPAGLKVKTHKLSDLEKWKTVFNLPHSWHDP